MTYPLGHRGKEAAVKKFCRDNKLYLFTYLIWHWNMKPKWKLIFNWYQNSIIVLTCHSIALSSWAVSITINSLIFFEATPRQRRSVVRAPTRTRRVRSSNLNGEKWKISLRETFVSHPFWGLWGPIMTHKKFGCSSLKLNFTPLKKEGWLTIENAKQF